MGLSLMLLTGLDRMTDHLDGLESYGNLRGFRLGHKPHKGCLNYT